MAAQPLNLERKVRQLDNDVQSIYELLSAIQGVQLRQTNRLDEIDRSIEATAVRLDGIDARLDGIDGRLDGIDGRLDGIDGRLDGIDGQLREIVELLRHRS